MGQSLSQWHRDLEQGRIGIDRNRDFARDELPGRIEQSLEMQRQLEMPIFGCPDCNRETMEYTGVKSPPEGR